MPQSRKPIFVEAFFCADKQNACRALFARLQCLVLNLQAWLSELREFAVWIVAVGAASEDDNNFALRVYSGIAVEAKLGRADPISDENNFTGNRLRR